jgi:hypothetical protein
MEIEFDFKEEKSRIFGAVMRPVARIILVNNDVEVPEHVYVDSGADVTLISKSVGDILGFKINEDDKITEIKGIGERGVPIIIKNAKIRIGEKLINAKIAWSLIEEVPLLLGREDIFRLFDICFCKNRKTVFKD